MSYDRRSAKAARLTVKEDGRGPRFVVGAEASHTGPERPPVRDPGREAPLQPSAPDALSQAAQPAEAVA
jgi:hypothetical protein